MIENGRQPGSGPELRRITDPAEIATIFGLADERLEDQVSMDRGEWVQYLQNQMHKEGWACMYGLIENGRVKKYMVAVNAVSPPISRAVLILYQNFFKDHENGKIALEKIKTWARQKGAQKIAIHTLYPRINKEFGFIKEPGENMYIPLD